ncbi:MAG: hypothetical protein ABIS51_02350 [Sphingomonas sp.]
MSLPDNALIEPGDPVVARLLRWSSGLRAGGNVAHDVLVTYLSEQGTRPFAFCRDGLLLDPDGEARFVRFVEIEDTGKFDRIMLEKEKRASRQGESIDTPLSIRLVSGEVLVLPLNVRGDGMSERLTIASLLEQRVRIARSQARKKATI